MCRVGPTVKLVAEIVEQVAMARQLMTMVRAMVIVGKQLVVMAVPMVAVVRLTAKPIVKKMAMLLRQQVTMKQMAMTMR